MKGTRPTPERVSEPLCPHVEEYPVEGRRPARQRVAGPLACSPLVEEE